MRLKRAAIITYTLSALAMLFGCASVMPEDPIPVPAPSISAEPEVSAQDASMFEGEWAGLLNSQNDKYLAKLTVLSSEAFLVLESYSEPEDAEGAYFGESAGSCGVRLSVLAASDAMLELEVSDIEYDSLSNMPYTAGEILELNLQNGSVLTGVDIELARIGEPGSSGYPRWNKQYNDFLPAVRGMFELTENLNVFVYEGGDGFERISGGFGEITHPTGEGDGRAFIVTFPMRDLFDGEKAPYWDSVITLDTATGNFVDVSEQFLDYYRDELIPRFEEALLLAMDEHDALEGEEEKAAIAPLVEAYTEALFRAHELVEGVRPHELIIDVPETEPDEDIY